MAQTQPSGQRGEHISVTQVASHLAGIDFPCTKQDLVQYAQQKHAPKELVDILNGLPDRTYSTMADVMEAVGEKI